jgi:predicted glycosyltransferase
MSDEENKPEEQLEEIDIPDNKAKESLMNQIHGLVALQIINTLKKKTITPQDLAQAIKFLKDNNIQADMDFNGSLTKVKDAFDEASKKFSSKTLPFPVKQAE